MRRRSYSVTVGILLALIVLLLCAMGYIVWLLLSAPDEQPEPVPTAEPALLTSEDLQPDRALFFHKVDGTLVNGQGQQCSLSALRGQPVVLLFWSSWCSDCKEYLAQGLSQAAQAARDSGAAFQLICREGIQDDTYQAAQQVLEQYGSAETTWMDPDAAFYHTLGLHSVPSLVVLDQQGRLVYATTHMPDAAAMHNLLAYANDPQAQTISLLRTLQDASGLLPSSFSVQSGALKPGNTVLSESQGLLMLWAASANDQPLFDQLWQGVSTTLSQGNLAAWQSQDGKLGQVNASLDDLRIIEALAMADNRWGGYADAAAARATTLYATCVRNNLLRDFADLDGATISKKVTLCYMDAAAMDAAAAYDPRWAHVANKATQLLSRADSLVSKTFPLYRTTYDADTDSFTGTQLQMNEAMVAVLNAVRAGVAFPDTLDWLASALASGPIYARYDESGQPVPGYRHESTATYALLVQIGIAADREDITLRALERMERQRCFEAPLLGGYGTPNDAELYSFDVLESLLAWQALGW